MHLGSFNSWINYTIYYNATKKKPLKSSVSKGICVSSSRLWHIVTAASLGCTGDRLPKAELSYSPLVTVKATECQCCQLHMLLHIWSFFVWVVISGFRYCISSHWISLFPQKVEEFLLTHPTWAAWDIKPSNIWACYGLWEGCNYW